MSERLHGGRDDQGYNFFVPQMSTDIYNVSLATSTEATMTVPSNATKWVASFSYQGGTVVWVAINNTAAVPAGATLAAANSVLNPGTLLLNAGDVIHMITPSASAEVSVALYIEGGSY
jgi:hypothetical protein